MTLRYGGGRRSLSVGCKIPAELYDELDKKHPRKGDRSRVLRSLIQMYLQGKITARLEFQTVDKI